MPNHKATACPRGHVYDEANTYVCSTGKQHCRACSRERVREYNRTNREKKRAREHAYRNGPGRERMKIIRKRADVKKKYGLSLEEYEAILGLGCAICGATTGKLVVDHCHTTGKIRSALCNQCNTGLGMFADDPDRAEAAAAYLRAHMEG